MDTTRRRLLGIFVFGVPAVLLAGCATRQLDSACYTPDGCSQIAAAAGLNQYDMLAMLNAGAPPADRIFSFAVLRNGQFVQPDPSEFVIAAAPDGTAADRSYDPARTELYTFQEGETVAFYEVFDT